jgi:hypothetical protein
MLPISALKDLWPFDAAHAMPRLAVPMALSVFFAMERPEQRNITPVIILRQILRRL